jgi:uncharacterized protein YjiS (DUF1127 family)
MSHISPPVTQDAFRFADPPVRAPQFRVWPALVATLALWHQRSRTRHDLGHLSDRMLADIGLTRDQQSYECDKSFWLL